MDFTQITADHIASLDLEGRKALGQYMTPASIGDEMARMLCIPPGSAPAVVDPACGTGELLLAVRRQCPDARLTGFDIDEGMLAAAERNVPSAEFRACSIFDPASRLEHGSYDFAIGNPPYFEMKKSAPDLRAGGVEGFASLEDKGRLNIYALFVEYALRLVRVGGAVSFLVPPSMNNGAFFKRLRRRVLELGRVSDIALIRENDAFSDALTSVQILLLVRTDDGYEHNLAASAPFVHETDSGVIFTDRKGVIDEFSRGKTPIGKQGFEVRTGTVVWNQHKAAFRAGQRAEARCQAIGKVAVPVIGGGFECPPAAGMLPVLFSKDIAADGSLALSSKISAPGHWLPEGAARVDCGSGIVVNRIVGSLENPRLRFALVELDRFYGENHVNVITRPDGDTAKVRALFDSLSALKPDELSAYLQAVTGNTQLSATELGELPVPDIS